MSPKEPAVFQVSIYDQIGGQRAVSLLVEKFYQRVLADQDLLPFFEKASLPRLKKQQIVFLSQALGGPAEYCGRTMKQAHAKLKIEQQHFDLAAKHLVATLEELSVAQELIDQIVGAVAALAPDIITEPKTRRAVDNRKPPTRMKTTSTQTVEKNGAHSSRQSAPDPAEEESIGPINEKELADLRGQVEAIHRSQAVIEFELDGTIITANDNFLETVGYRLEEIQGRHHSLFIDPALGASAEYKQFWADLKEGQSKSGEFQRFGKGGREIWIEASYNPILDADLLPFKVVKYAVDVTKRKQENADLSGQLEAISKSQAVIEFNLDGTIITANDNFVKTVGYRLEEIKGQHHRLFVSPDYANSPEYAQFWRDLSNGQHSSGRYQRFGKGGEEIWIEASYNPILDQNGRPFKVVKFATDITESVKRERVNQRYSSMSDNSPINIMFADTEGVIQYANRASEETLKSIEHLLPCRASEVIGQNIDIFHKNPAYQRGIINNSKNLPRNAHIKVGEETLDLLVSPIIDEDGQYLGPMVTWDIITKRLEAEERERQLTSGLKETLDTVERNSQALSSSAEELSATAQEMSSNSEETTAQANVAASAAGQVSRNVATVATSAEEMSASAKEIAKSASEAAMVAT